MILYAPIFNNVSVLYNIIMTRDWEIIETGFRKINFRPGRARKSRCAGNQK